MLCILWREGLRCYLCTVKPAYSYIAQASRYRLSIPFFFYCMMLLDLWMIERLRQIMTFTTWICTVSRHTMCCLCVCAQVFVLDLGMFSWWLCGQWICSDIRGVPWGAVSSPGLHSKWQTETENGEWDRLCMTPWAWIKLSGCVGDIHVAAAGKSWFER